MEYQQEEYVTTAKDSSQPDLMQKLAAEASSLKRRLDEVNQAIEALKSNPEIERILRLLSKVNFRL